MICKISYRIDIILVFSKDMYLWKYKIAINELDIKFMNVKHISLTKFLYFTYVMRIIILVLSYLLLETLDHEI
jgi:hypothetical protein